MTRALFYDLVELGEERDVDGTRMFGVASGGEFFAMAPADTLKESALNGHGRAAWRVARRRPRFLRPRAQKPLTLDVPPALTDPRITDFARGDLDRDPPSGTRPA